MCVCLSVCPYATIQVQLFTVLHNNVYSTYFKKIYIYCCRTIYIVRISGKNYIYCCTTIYMYFKEKLYTLF
jgi:hypothetical protein